MASPIRTCWASGRIANGKEWEC